MYSPGGTEEMLQMKATFKTDGVSFSSLIVKCMLCQYDDFNPKKVGTKPQAEKLYDSLKDIFKHLISHHEREFRDEFIGGLENSPVLK